MRLGVVGAGWFGAFLAKHLIESGHVVTLYERRSLFAEASGNNQDRLHVGFHYPRSAKTRAEIRHCYDQFLAAFPTVEVKDNIYAVAGTSSIDFGTYLAIMRSEGLEFEVVNPSDFGLRNVEGAIRTRERVVCTGACVNILRKVVESSTVFEEASSVVQGDGEVAVRSTNGVSYYDAVLNCTNLRLGDAKLPVYFEAAMSLEVCGPANHHSFTIMDGQFPTLLATPSPRVYTVSHVRHTAVAKCDTYEEAERAYKSIDLAERTAKFTEGVEVFYPDFSKLFTVAGFRGAVRTKPKNGTDSRECITHADGRVMTVVCGKFASIFLAAERVDAWLRCF